jgi:hypothetical protein
MVISEVLPEVNKVAAMDVIMFAEDFVFCGANELTSPIDSFVLLTWILKFLEEAKK